MPRTRRHVALTGLATLDLAITSIAVGSGSADASGTAYGCPHGAFCIYPQNASLTAGPEPGGIYYSYGVHNLRSQYGYHAMYNNQYGGAGFKLCLTYGGTGCSGTQRTTGGYSPYDLTGINSIVLVP